MALIILLPFCDVQFDLIWIKYSKSEMCQFIYNILQA